jgi:hypothetical protein
MDDTNSGGVVESSQARSFMGLDSVIKICPYNSTIQCVCARIIPGTEFEKTQWMVYRQVKRADQNLYFDWLGL